MLLLVIDQKKLLMPQQVQVYLLQMYWLITLFSENMQ